IFVNMKPWDERTSRKDQINAVLGATNGYLFGMRNARGFAFNLPEIIGLGTNAGLEMNLQDRGVNDVQRFAGLVNDFTREAIGRPYVRGPNQHMVPVSALTRTQFQTGPSVLTRFNGFTSALVIGAPAPGKSSGQMLDAVERLVQEKYGSQGVGYAFSGQSYQERASGGQGGLVFALGLVMGFLVLAAQYESWPIPFAVVLAAPFGTLGAL